MHRLIRPGFSALGIDLAASNMDSTQISLLILGFILCIGVQNAAGWQCYVCNSAAKYEGAKCDEPEKYKNELLRDCTGNVTTQYCRKMKQDVDGDFRIVRDCAIEVREDGLKCVERTGTSKVKITYCECEGKGCNTGSFNVIAPLSLLLALILSLISTQS